MLPRKVRVDARAAANTLLMMMSGGRRIVGIDWCRRKDMVPLAEISCLEGASKARQVRRIRGDSME
ncbi:hypothetical protein C2U69_21095 [Cupriavidus pinatubonensis]|nr:hypothetical protein C2U69_21095 [Cupriavidus pinatubonensis]